MLYRFIKVLLKSHNKKYMKQSYNVKSIFWISQDLKSGSSCILLIFILMLCIFFAFSILRSLWEASKGGPRVQKKSATGWMVPQAGAIWTDELGEEAVCFFESRVNTQTGSDLPNLVETGAKACLHDGGRRRSRAQLYAEAATAAGGRRQPADIWVSAGELA